MDKEFTPKDIDVTWTEEELWKVVRKRGYAPSGMPSIWGHGFAMWYLSGGREEIAKARKEMWAALRAVEVGLAG